MSSCVVTARLSLDGRKFEGTYRNVQFGTTGQIAGLLCADDRKVSKFRLKDAPAFSKQSAELAGAVVPGLQYYYHKSTRKAIALILSAAAGIISCFLVDYILLFLDWLFHSLIVYLPKTS